MTTPTALFSCLIPCNLFSRRSSPGSPVPASFQSGFSLLLRTRNLITPPSAITATTTTAVLHCTSYTWHPKYSRRSTLNKLPAPTMGRRGRPTLNITPEERLQRRRSQLVASQRKRRAHKRLLSQPAASTSEPSPAATSERLLPGIPTALHLVYDAMILGHRTGVAVSQHQGVDAAITDTNTNTTLSPNARSPPPAICHHCGSAPLDTAAIPAAVSPASPASLLWTRQLGTDTHALSSRLASPSPPSPTRADYTNADEPDDAGTDKNSFTYIASHSSLFGRQTDSFDCLGPSLPSEGELETSSSWLKRPVHAFATGIDNVFFPGRATYTADSLWMPSSPPEDGPMLTGATLYDPALCGPALSDDSIEFWTPWTGAKQVSLC